MEAEKNKAGNMNSVLRQALERRQTEHLSSNFSYRICLLYTSDAADE